MPALSTIRLGPRNEHQETRIKNKTAGTLISPRVKALPNRESLIGQKALPFLYLLRPSTLRQAQGPEQHRGTPTR